MVVKNIGLAWITVSDFAKSKHFFTETLGSKISSIAEEYGWLELKAQESDFLLCVGKDSAENIIKPGKNAVVTLTVENALTAKAEFEAKKIKVGKIQEILGHVKMAFFQDHDGNYFQLIEALDGK